MSRRIFITGIIALFAFTSCDEFMDQGITVDSGNYASDFVIPPTAKEGHLLIRETIESNLDQTLKDHGNAGVTVKSINISSIVVSVAPGSPIENFDALENLNAILKTDNGQIDTISKYINTSTGVTVINMEPVVLDVADYLGANEYILVLDGKLKEALTDSLKINYDMNYKINIGLTGSSN